MRRIDRLAISACGETAEYLNAHPELAEEIAQATQKLVARNPEMQRQLERQEQRLQKLKIYRK